MENLSVLMGLFDHLNKHNSKIFIEHFDSHTGVIKLSDDKELNIIELGSLKKIESCFETPIELSGHK